MEDIILEGFGLMGPATDRTGYTIYQDQDMQSHVHIDNIYMDLSGYRETSATSPKPDGDYGIYAIDTESVGVELPSFQYLFHPTATVLTIKKLTNLLTPKFSPEGSNSVQQEKAVYGRFIKYLREVAAGRRGNITLGEVLSFATSCDDEPVLGFKIHPEIHFPDAGNSYIPTANTCINLLCLPKAPVLHQLPHEDAMFSAYDYAFCNNFFGLK